MDLIFVNGVSVVSSFPDLLTEPVQRGVKVSVRECGTVSIVRIERFNFVRFTVRQGIRTPSRTAREYRANLYLWYSLIYMQILLEIKKKLH
jgi:hypothetical protein